MASDCKELSFIIPAYDEENTIALCIHEIRHHVPASMRYEIIVIDHDSADSTFKVAQQSGASVFTKVGGTVGSLRNYGVSKACGHVLVFLDADVLLTAKWSLHIEDVLNTLRADENILTGSWVSVPSDTNWIGHHWYRPLEGGDNTHINTGHMIITRRYFLGNEGFTESLETGEDYNFSMRVKNAGGKIVDDHRLKVIHKGFPENMAQFMRREFWHGKGDAYSLKGLLASKVALVALAFLGLHIALLISIFVPGQTSLSLGLAFTIIALVLATATIKYSNAPIATILVNSLLYYCYFWARGASLLVFFARNNAIKHHR